MYFFKTSTLYDLRDGYFDIMDIMSNIFSPMHMILTHKLPDKKNKSVHVQKNCSQVILPTHISHEKKHETEYDRSHYNHDDTRPK